MNKKVKLCKDCKYFKDHQDVFIIYSDNNYTGRYKEVCLKLSYPTPKQLVTGEQQYMPCIIARVFENSCSQTAKYFEPKEKEK
jgi:hypothetical protein